MEKFYLKGLYYTLHGLLFFILLKYVYDFYTLNVDEHDSIAVEEDKTFTNPRLQIENDNYYYVVADSGIFTDEDGYELSNVKIKSNLGEGSSDNGYINNDTVRMYNNVKFKLKQQNIK
ncbi:MAG: hypothetical protein LBC92_03920 [Rickettsiales bacterium]|jgi:hypothetical protein|nr:hypothetical protein [Rickettsiales bacterium]